MPFGQRFYYPIYEACERHGLPLAIHPGTEGMGINQQPTPGYPTHYVEWHCAMSLSLTWTNERVLRPRCSRCDLS